MGSDTSRFKVTTSKIDFNPRSPHGERPVERRYFIKISDFNPRSPHGERRYYDDFLHLTDEISIHAPRMGSDFPSLTVMLDSFVFQSTLPAWGATDLMVLESFCSIISIHAPRMGSDIDRDF